MRVVEIQPIANIEVMHIEGERVHMSGWVVHRAHPLSHVTLVVNSRPWANDVPLFDRPDVGRHLYPKLPHTIRSGFKVTLPVDRSQWVEGANKLELIVKSGAKEQGVATIAVRDLAKDAERFPVPSQILKLHVGLKRDDFLATGWRVYSDLKREVGRFGGWATFDRVLDWGCGCGRVLRYLLEDVPAERVFGCDIDREAIEWLARNARESSFEAIQPAPPTPYPEGHFDLIYGVSIFTHLSEEMQDEWLDELARISRPGALVAVTLHGWDLAPRRLRRSLQKRGFAEMGSAQAAYFAPYAGGRYYRTAFHTPAYVESHWSRHFDLLEYRSRAINAHQDLVVMRKR